MIWFTVQMRIFFLNFIIENTKVSGYGTRAMRFPKNMFVSVPFPIVSSTLIAIPLIRFLIAKISATRAIRLFLRRLSSCSMIFAMIKNWITWPWNNTGIQFCEQLDAERNMKSVIPFWNFKQLGRNFCRQLNVDDGAIDGLSTCTEIVGEWEKQHTDYSINWCINNINVAYSFFYLGYCDSCSENPCRIIWRRRMQIISF